MFSTPRVQISDTEGFQELTYELVDGNSCLCRIKPISREEFISRLKQIKAGYV